MVCRLSRQIAPGLRKTILDLHNIESVLHARCAASDPPRSSRIVSSSWPHWNSNAAGCRVFAGLCRFGTRRRSREAIAPTADVRVYPNAIPARPIPAEMRSHVIVFSGNMEYHPNRGAVRFFRRQIWPQLRDSHPGLVWRLVGKNPEAVRAFTEDDPRIEVIGEVEDAVAELARAEVAIVPLLAGSGTRLKILEAWSAGTPVVSTSIGAEGLPVCDRNTCYLPMGPRLSLELSPGYWRAVIFASA